MNLVPLFAVMFGLLVINTVIIFYLLAKYKEAKHEAQINRPPFQGGAIDLRYKFVTKTLRNALKMSEVSAKISI